jgi:hypothetical protein
VNNERSRTVLFATSQIGPAPTWTWRYIGVLGGREEAEALGGARLVSPNLSRGRDSSLLLLISPHRGDSSVVGLGCTALEVISLEPPLLRRDCNGDLVIRAQQTGADTSWHTGACTYDPQSVTGIISGASVTGAVMQANLRTIR